MDRLCLQASALAQVLEAVGHLRDISDAAARAPFSRGDVRFATRHVTGDRCTAPPGRREGRRYCLPEISGPRTAPLGDDAF